jgi:hypothetical protein
MNKKNLQCPTFKSISTFLLLLFFTLHVNTILFAQVKFSAVGSAKTMSKNDLFDVQYIVENAANVEQITPPSFKNFTVVSGPTHQSGMTNINGNVKQFVGIEFLLKPNGPGNFTLPPATAKVDGKTLQSNSLSIQVTNNTSGASSGGTSISPFANVLPDLFSAPSKHQYDDYILRKGEKPDDKIKKNLFVNAELNKTTCYVGEPIIATYKLYTRLKSETNVTKNPSFNGFSVIDLEMPDNFTERSQKYNGRDYTVYTLRKVQLYPLQSGTIELEPIEVDNNVTFIKGDYANAGDDVFFDIMRNFAGGGYMGDEVQNQKVTLQSKPVNIIVKPLPLAGQPKEFKGAVGNFKIDAKLQKDDAMTTDEAGNLSISISGNGNLQMINAPDISWPEGIEAFEPKLSENIDKSSVPLKGEKVFNYAFTVSKPALYTIPPISFSYFDNNTEAYKIVTTKPLTINVTKGKSNRQTLISPVNINNKPEGVIQKFFNQLWVLLVAGFAISGLIVFLILKSIRKKNLVSKSSTEEKNKTQEASISTKEEIEVYQDPLHEAEEALLQNDTGNFYHTINNCLRKYLSGKLKYPEKELTRKKINELLDNHNVGVGTTLILTSLLDKIEMNLYAPLSSANQMQDVYETASEVISLLDKQY